MLAHDNNVKHRCVIKSHNSTIYNVKLHAENIGDNPSVLFQRGRFHEDQSHNYCKESCGRTVGIFVQINNDT